MSDPIIKPVILCGGSGTPVRRLKLEALPKQFAYLIVGKSLQHTALESLAALDQTLVARTINTASCQP